MAETRLFFWLFFLLQVSPSESSDVVGHEPVQVTVGDDVILPCHLEPPFDVNKLTVHWTRNDHTVHVYRNRADDYDDQDEQFRGRTSLFPGELVKGNISLKLINVTEEDSGLYICYVPRLENQVKRGDINLTVNPQKDPEGGDNETPGDKKPTRDGNRGVIVGSILGPLLSIFAVSAVIIIVWFIKWRRNNLEAYEPAPR